MTIRWKAMQILSSKDHAMHCLKYRYLGYKNLVEFSDTIEKQYLFLVQTIGKWPTKIRPFMLTLSTSTSFRFLFSSCLLLHRIFCLHFALFQDLFWSFQFMFRTLLVARASHLGLFHSRMAWWKAIILTFLALVFEISVVIFLVIGLCIWFNLLFSRHFAYLSLL